MIEWTAANSRWLCWPCHEGRQKWAWEYIKETAKENRWTSLGIYSSFEPSDFTRLTVFDFRSSKSSIHASSLSAVLTPSTHSPCMDDVLLLEQGKRFSFKRCFTSVTVLVKSQTRRVDKLNGGCLYKSARSLHSPTVFPKNHVGISALDYLFLSQLSETNSCRVFLSADVILILSWFVFRILVLKNVS